MISLQLSTQEFCASRSQRRQQRPAVGGAEKARHHRQLVWRLGDYFLPVDCTVPAASRRVVSLVGSQPADCRALRRVVRALQPPPV